MQIQIKSDETTKINEAKLHLFTHYDFRKNAVTDSYEFKGKTSQYPESQYWLGVITTGDGTKIDLYPVGTSANPLDDLLAPSFEIPLVFGVIVAIAIKRRKYDE